MKTKTAAVLFIGILCCAAPLVAHHAFESEFDVNKAIHIVGKVIKVEWGNPHVYFDIAVADSNGTMVNWRVETISPNNLIRAGLSRNTVSLGSEMTVEGFVAKSGDRIVGSSSFILKSSGKNVATPPAEWHHSFAENMTLRRPSK